jgi:hypothetical protein|tara:strand:+ start:448 stop:1914 length:1467 start_codon:yes stop_codon:yes gene_type:complete
MKNLFDTSPEEKDRIRNLHESYKNVHGTTSLLKEQGSDRTLQGVVKDKKTKEALIGANIFITERAGQSKTGTAADSNGKFKLSGIKPGETVTMSFVGYNDNVINSTTIDTKNGIDEEFLLIAGNKLGEVKVNADNVNSDDYTGCMDKKAKNFDEKNWIDCNGNKFKPEYNVDDETKDAELVINFDEVDNSCCEYYKGCLDPVAENYWEKVDSFVKLKEEHPEKEIQACKNNKCCKYIMGCTDTEATNHDPKATKDDGSCIDHTKGCDDPIALNYNPDATKGCLDENKDGKPDCCKYAAGQQSGLEQIKKNFADYYNNKIFASTINLYDDADGRDSRNPKELVGNYKVDNETPVPIMKGDNYVGFTIPLLPDSRAIKALEAKLATNLSDKKRRKLEDNLELLKSSDMGLVVTFGRNTKELLDWVFNASQTITPPTLKTYLKPRGSNKKGDRVYVGPKEFTQKGLDKLINFLKAYNLQNAKVPNTSSTEY